MQSRPGFARLLPLLVLTGLAAATIALLASARPVQAPAAECALGAGRGFARASRLALAPAPTFGVSVAVASRRGSLRPPSWPSRLASDRAAFKNGAAVLRLLRAQSPGAVHRLRRYLGRRVAFTGGAEPPGGTANLLIGEDVHLKVNLVPYRDVRPQAAGWDAWVVGMLKGVDYRHKVLVIQARPGDWHVGDTT